MKGKIIFFAGIFMVATGLPLTLFAMHLVGEMTEFGQITSSFSGMQVFPDEPVIIKKVLSSFDPLTVSAALDPQHIPINIQIKNNDRTYELLNETIDSNQSLEIIKHVTEMEYSIILTNLGSGPVWIELEIFDSKQTELQPLQRLYSKIVIIFYYVFFFGGIATIVTGAILWRKRK